MIKVLNQENTILSRYVAQLRDEVTQRDPMRFRRNLERTGEVMAYEISKTLNYRAETVVTPLGEAEVMVPARWTLSGFDAVALVYSYRLLWNR